jgi:acetylornithine deacetylase
MVNMPTFKESLSRLIAAPTVSSIDAHYDQSNAAAATMLADWLETLGFKVELQTVSEAPEKVNIIACIGQGEAGLVLSGHTDTVPFDEDLWDQDPFKLTEKDDRYYGLGVTDMKCFFPIILDVLQTIDLKRIKQPLYILGTCDEESTMAGARALVNSERSLGRNALIGEPTGLKPINMHKGILMESINLIGRSGHSSNPALGINAMEGMNGVINDLLAWRSEWQKEHPGPAFEVPYPTLNFGSIHGGDNPNRICADCEITIDMRLLPGMDSQETRAQIRQTVLQSIDGKDLIAEFDALVEGIAPMQTPLDAEIVKIAERLSGEPTGSVAFGTEGPFFNSNGMDTVIIGPGDIDVAHQANEFLSLDRIEPMKKIVTGMIEHFCMKDMKDVA